MQTEDLQMSLSVDMIAIKGVGRTNTRVKWTFVEIMNKDQRFLF